MEQSDHSRLCPDKKNSLSVEQFTFFFCAQNLFFSLDNGNFIFFLVFFLFGSDINDNVSHFDW